MKSVHSEAPPASRPVPEVCGNVLGNGHAVGEGSGSDGAGEAAAPGTSVGIPAGIWALAVAAPCHAQTPTISNVSSVWRRGCRARSPRTPWTIHQETVF